MTNLEVEEPDPEAENQPAEPAGQTKLSWVSDHRYFLLGGALMLLMLSFLLQLRWPGGIDIWEHAAAARELGAHPFDPQHPLLPVDRPHQFFSPYLMAVGLFSRFTGLSVVLALNVAAVFNLVLVLVGLRLFVRRLTSRPHVDFYALIFILFLWGPGAWFFSGFLHFDVLAFVLSYPSTFARGLVFLSLWAHLRYLESDDNRWLVPTVAVCALVLLAHPVDAVFLGIAVLSLSVTHPGERLRHVAFGLTALGLGFLLACLWPPLPFLDMLFGSESASFRLAIAGGDRDMYSKVLPRLGLALLVLPFALRRIWTWQKQPLALMFFGTLAAYALGYYTEQWSYGRLISSVQIVGAIILAEDRAAASEAAAALGARARPLLRWAQLTTAAIVLLGIYYMRNGFSVLPESITAHARPEWVHSYVDKARISDYDFVADHHRKYPVVIADLYTSLELPTFGTKVIAFARTQAFVNTAQRGSDVNRFFESSSTREVRRQIIDKYGASLLVVKVSDLTSQPYRYRPIVELGRIVSRNDRFVFVDLRSPPN